MSQSVTIQGVTITRKCGPEREDHESRILIELWVSPHPLDEYGAVAELTPMQAREIAGALIEAAAG